MLLLLARHGNTFESGDKAVWAGARTDLPLTEKGRDQADALGRALAPVSDRIKTIVSGPLTRTREHASRVAQVLRFGNPIEIEERLREIDYGLWEGKSQDEIHASGGERELKAWNESGVWPKSPGWAPSEQTVTDHIAHLANERAASGNGDVVLVVTSNGILRFFLKLIPGAFEEAAAGGALKVATGNCCALRHSKAGWGLAFWNCLPSGLALE